MTKGWAERNSKSGFTIVELLIVIVVIAILAAITTVAYSGMQQRARDAQRISATRTVQKALEMYRVDNGAYPNICFDENGVVKNSAGTGIHCEATNLASALAPKYISEIPDTSMFAEHQRLFYAAGHAVNGPHYQMYALAFGDGSGPGIEAKCRITSPGLELGDLGYSHFSPPGEAIKSCY